MTTRWTAWFKRQALWMALVAGVVGCGGRPGPTPASVDARGPIEENQSGGFEAPPPQAPEVSSYEGDASHFEAEAASEQGGSPLPSKPSSAPAREELSRSRPGLGTVWGEDRESTVRHTAFHRADPDRPFALASLFYNDREGIEAMASESARFDHGDGGFRLMDGAVSVRLLDENGRPLPSFEI